MRAREYKYNGDVLYLKCTKCGEWGILNEFPKNSQKKFGVRPYCKVCAKKIKSKFYFAHRERLLKEGREYSKSHRKERSIKARIWCENNRDIVNESQRKYRQQNKEKIMKAQKERIRKYTSEFGFSWKSFHRKATMYVKKYGLRPNICPICGVDGNIEMHHPSYNSWDEWKNIVFCCHKCHKHIHIGEIECPSAINLLTLNK